MFNCSNLTLISSLIKMAKSMWEVSKEPMTMEVQEVACGQNSLHEGRWRISQLLHVRKLRCLFSTDLMIMVF